MIVHERERLLEALEVSVARLSALVRSARNLDARAVGDWSVRDVAAHLADVFARYPPMVQGEGLSIDSIDAMSRVNARGVEERSTDDLNAFADQIDEHGARFVKNAGDLDGDPEIPWIEGIRLPVSTIAAIALGESIVHGFDIARGERAPWSIDPDHARLVAWGIAPLAPHYVDKDKAHGLKATYDVRMRGGPEMFFDFDDGTLRIARASRPADCHISADPVAFMLVSYGRMGPWKPALTGKMIAWGRKPWLALKLPALLKSP